MFKLRVLVTAQQDDVTKETVACVVYIITPCVLLFLRQTVIFLTCKIIF